MQLSKRAVLAGGWTFGGHVASQCLRFGGNLLMTRLLAPEYFGVMALAFTFVFALNMASDLGLQQVATSSQRGDDADFLETIWTLEILRGAIIFLAGLLISGLLPVASRIGWLGGDSTYAHPDLPLALALICFSAFISSTNSVKLITKARQLLVARVILLDLASQVAGLVSMIAWALYSPGVLALAVGSIVAAVVKSALSHLAIPGVAARLRWDGRIVREIIAFGRWVFLSSILGFLVISLDKIILGAQLDATRFGVYTVALLLMMAPQEVMQRIVSAVVFPALSEVARERPAQVGPTYYRTRTLIDAASILTAALLFALGGDIVRILYDQRYLAAGKTLQILALSLPMIGLAASSQIYMAIGKPWLVSVLLMPRLAGMAIALPLLTSSHGLVGAAWAIVISQWSSLPFVYAYLWRNRILSLRGEVRFWLGLLACFALALSMGGGYDLLFGSQP